MKNTIFFYLIFLFCSVVNSKEFCSFNDILNQKKKLFCKNGDLIFGNFKFSSKNNDFEYEIIGELKIKVLKKFKKEKFLFINTNCDKEKSIKIKEITDYIDSKENYVTKVIISCYLQNE
tara:strand:+ start:911 stop:1267 length:357 start_codon:yes stop_codon:yes gene_type:complete